MSAPALRAEGLSKRYGERAVVQSLDLEVGPGEVVGLLGPNGAGKTTTFNLVIGAVKPTTGRVFFGARDITELTMYRRARLGIIYLPQEPSVFSGLTVQGNLDAVLETTKRSAKARRDRREELLEEFGLARLARQRADALSGGERRRLEIARALVLDPAFLLLDEPYTGIDPITVGEIQELVRKLAQRGIGIVLTEHRVREALGVCHRAYVVNDGRILRQGTPQEITADPAVRKIFLGEDFALT